MTEEERYVRKRLRKARLMSIPFYLNRICPINSKKIVFTCIEGTTGFTCNPKYIALELMRRIDADAGDNHAGSGYELVWLVNDTSKKFPKGIKVCRNTLWRRAYHLATAGVWVDNSRKQLECRKRRGQVYIQTWHAKLGFKPTCLDRGTSFSRIAYLVSKHDSDMVDYWLSNSDWYDRTLPTGSLYEGKTLRTGSPRCDILVNAVRDLEFKQRVKRNICERFKIQADADTVHFLMYAPTFRGGSQSTDRSISAGSHFPDYGRLKASLEARFKGTWIIMLRLHPQLVARHVQAETAMNASTIDVSLADDMYELLAGCDAFMTDYSSAAFDAAVMKMPIFLYCDDYSEYEGERGRLLWNLRELPFPLAENDDELARQIESYDNDDYQAKLDTLMTETGMIEDGTAARRVADVIDDIVKHRRKS